MKICCILLIPILLACAAPKQEVNFAESHRIIQQLTSNLAEAEINDKLNTLISYYDVRAVSMPEYQLTLVGHDDIKYYYTEILKRQTVKSYVPVADEFIQLGNTVVEIGTFKKEYVTDSNPDSIIVLNGKYWHIWEAAPNRTFKLLGEAFGYFKPVQHPEMLTVQLNKIQPDESDILQQKEIPLELKAYNALMEKGVKNRDGILRSGFFTSDARFFPFAEPTVTGIENIKPYIIAYSSRGQITIDSVMCYTYDFQYAGNYILEYAMFKVKWTNANGKGRTEGKSIRIWQRQKDNSLRLFREIGTHNLL